MLTSSVDVLTLTVLVRTANETERFEFKFKFKQLQVWNSERMSRGTRGARLHAPLIRFLHVTYTSDLISRSQCRANKASFVRTLSRFVAQLHRDSPGHLVRTSCIASPKECSMNTRACISNNTLEIERLDSLSCARPLRLISFQSVTPSCNYSQITSLQGPVRFKKG